MTGSVAIQRAVALGARSSLWRSIGLAALVGILPTQSVGEALYQDVTESSRLDFVSRSGGTGDKQYWEVIGSGGAAIDIEPDGDLDIYLVTPVGSNRLFRNDGDLRFVDVTQASGVGDEGYGMGAVAGDVDNDGLVDLYVTNRGANVLYRNVGGGRFEDATTAADVGDSLWGCGASFLDADLDGWLDLYVTNYVGVSEPDTNECFAKDGLRLYCAPRHYERQDDVYYRNRGDGTFEDLTKEAGLGGPLGRGLGTVIVDYNNDGFPDIYVANDQDPNLLYENRGDGTFEEMGLLAGASHAEDGNLESGMGVAAGDYDRDGWIDLFVTNYINETNTLYHNEGDGFFLDESATSGLGPISLPYVGWGTHFFDYDDDGWLDLFLVNGHTEPDCEHVDPTTSWKQREFLMRNERDGTFADVTAEVAPDWLEKNPTRAALFADFDNDGDLEILFVHQESNVQLFERRQAPSNWVGLELRTATGRSAVGARVELYSGGACLVREVRAGEGFLTSHDPRLTFALSAPVDSVVVRWPGGAVLRRDELIPNRYTRIEEGGS